MEGGRCRQRGEAVATTAMEVDESEEEQGRIEGSDDVEGDEREWKWQDKDTRKSKER